MPINKELFAKVRDKILSVPEAYKQDDYGSKAETPCGTRACIGGHALIEGGFCTPKELNERRRMTPQGVERFSVHRRAQELLGLSDAESEQLLGSGAGEEWAEPFSSEFMDAVDSEEEAQVAADYINWIIKNERVR